MTIVVLSTFLISLAAFFVLGDSAPLFLISGIVAYLFNPLVAKMSKFASRTISAAMMILIIISSICWLGFVLFPVIRHEIAAIADNSPEYARSIADFIHRMVGESTLIKKIQQYVNIHKEVNVLFGVFFHYITQSVVQIMSSSVLLINVLFSLMFLPFMSFYMLKDWNSMLAMALNIIPARYRGDTMELFTAIDKKLGSYLRGQTVVCGILAVYYGAALLTFGIPFAIFIGTLTGCAAFIPYIGFLIGFAIAICIAIPMGSIHSIFAVLAIFAIGAVLDSAILSPRLIGKSVELHPLWIILSLFVTGHLFGVVGVLFTIPIASIASVAVRFMYKDYIGTSFYKNEPT